MADHNENLKDTLNEEIEHADQKPAEEHYSLNDDRRVKVLSPGMLVTKRFFRNRLAVTGMAILVFMFVFSFIGGLISPYEQDKFFYGGGLRHPSSVAGAGAAAGIPPGGG